MFESADGLERLNDDQRRAAVHDGGPLLILAGAGTGKTGTLVARATWLRSRGIPASRILLLTFTRRAADDIMARVAPASAAASERSAGARSTRSRTGSSASTPSRSRCRRSSACSTRPTSPT